MSVLALKAPLLQCAGFLSRLSSPQVLLEAGLEIPGLKAVKGMQSGQKPVVALISVLPHNNPNRISLQFDDIGIRHKLTLAQ